MDHAELQKAGYDVPVSKPPSAADVAARAIILRHVAVYALILISPCAGWMIRPRNPSARRIAKSP